jgi:hypothetical protein
MSKGGKFKQSAQETVERGRLQGQVRDYLQTVFPRSRMVGSSIKRTGRAGRSKGGIFATPKNIITSYWNNTRGDRNDSTFCKYNKIETKRPLFVDVGKGN